jgi:hypothetical protein
VPLLNQSRYRPQGSAGCLVFRPGEAWNGKVIRSTILGASWQTGSLSGDSEMSMTN